MINILKTSIIPIFLLSLFGCSDTKSKELASDMAFVDSLMARMTLEEKLGQMTQVDRQFLSDISDISKYGLGSLLSGGGSTPEVNKPKAWADMYDSYQREALKSRLKIPLIYGIDAVHGHNNVVGATIFPHNIGLGATRDPQIVEAVARATALDLGVIVKTNFFSKTDDRNNGMRIGMSISNYGSKMRYDGIDLINPIDILENENGNYEDVIGQFRTESWEMPLIFRLGASVKPIAGDNQTLIISTDVLHPNNNSESINMGTEYSLRMVGGNTFFLRGGVKGLGIAQANEKRSLSNIELPFSTLTFGLGYEKTIARNKSVGIDYSYQSIGLLGDVSLITVRFKLF